MKDSKIEWTNHTFNPWVGCEKVSPGCANCYAEADMDKRRGFVRWGKGQPRRRTSESNWKEPLKWNNEARGLKERPRVFCASLADVFDLAVPDKWQDDLANLISRTPFLDWMLLTKRPENFKRWEKLVTFSNVWLGVSVEDQKRADERIPLLQMAPAKVRFLSIEPLLENIDIRKYLPHWACQSCGEKVFSHGLDLENQLCTPGCRSKWAIENGHPTTGQIGLVIVGGESGTKKRPFNVDWARSLREQCKAVGTPFFMKQIDKVQEIPDDLMIREMI